MSEDRSSDDELWGWESQCFFEVENQPNYELQLQEERDVTNQKLWHLFQNSATCIAHLHKGASIGGPPERNPRWMPFQTAAGTVTALYKESVDGVRRCTELGVLHGQQRRTRELVSLLRRRRLVRREELLAVLCGRPPPARSGHRSSGRGGPVWPAPERPPSRPAAGQTRPPTSESCPLTAAGGHLAAGLGQPSPAGGCRRRSPGCRRASRSLSPLDLTPVKRPATPASPSDVVMDSPTHKRPRYT